MKKKQIPMNALIKLISFYSLIIGIIGTILFFGITLTKQSSSPSPTPTITVAPSLSSSPTETENTEGKFCGGIAGIQCPNGYTCQLDGNYPDAGGTCVKGKTTGQTEKQVFCTMDAMQCPDGSFVGREGPNCKFAPCPGMKQNN
jgi:hypothetical protein